MTKEQNHRLLETVKSLLENNGGLIDSLEGPDTYVMVARLDFQQLTEVVTEIYEQPPHPQLREG